MAKFFIHRPVFAIVISLIILIAGGIEHLHPADRAVSADLAADRRSRNQLSRRERRNGGAIHRHQRRGRSQRRREHDLHVLEVVERRPVRADLHIQSRRQSRPGERGHQQPREQGHGQAAAGGHQLRHFGQEEVAGYPAGDLGLLAGQHLTTRPSFPTTPPSTWWTRSRASRASAPR